MSDGTVRAFPGVSDAGAASPAKTLGIWCLMAYLFFLQSRILDFTVPHLHLPLILLFVLTCMALLSGNLATALRMPAGRLMIVFVFLLGISTLFSIDRRQSAVIVIGDTRHLVVCIAMMTLMVMAQDIRRCLQAMAWGTLVAAILGFIFHVSVEGQRLGLAVGRFGDPNDYAMVLLMGFPFWLTVGSGLPRLVVGLPAAVIICFSFARTGSRGGLLAFVALTAAYFITTSFLGKARVVLLLAAGVTGAMIIVPASIQQRYFTVFTAEDDPLGSAEESARIQGIIHSANSRKQLLLASIKATFTHPAFGVGPGNFPTYYWKQGYIEENRNRQGMHTHNTYSQVSSEAGIPAAICFITVVFLCFRMSWKAGREERLAPDHPIRVCGLALWLSMISWATAAMFLSTAWTETLFFYVAMTSSLSLIHRTTVGALQKQPEAQEQPAGPCLPAGRGRSYGR